MKTEEKFMRAALKEALKAYKKGEVPIGAVIVREGKIVARAHNLREKRQVATAHAEILCIEKACKKLGSWRLDDCEMFVTVEPCPMCAGAVLNARMKKVYFGAFDRKGGAAESNFSILTSGVLNWSAEFVSGILKDDCERMMKEFFAERRKEN